MDKKEKFEVSKIMLENWVSRGMTIIEIADTLTELAGKKCSPASVRSLCKFYSINLRKKPRTFFVPVDNNTNYEVKVGTEQIKKDVEELRREAEEFINRV